MVFLRTASSQQVPDAPVMDRIHALAREAQACGADLGCLARVQQEMQALSRELTPPGAPPGIPPTDAQEQFTRSQAAAAAAKDVLSAQQDDPCYAIAHQKLIARRMHGSDLPWLSCTPLELRVTWTINERDSLEDFEGGYVVKQSYPGYLAIERAQHDRLRVLSYRIVSPAPHGRAQPENVLSAGSASLTGVQYRGILAPQPYEKKSFGSTATADFSIAREHGSLEFEYELSSPRGEQVIAHHLNAWGPHVSVVLQRAGTNLGHTFWQPQLEQFGAEAFSREAFEEGLRSGRLTWRAPVKFSQAYLQQTGSVEVTILFDHEPGRLSVTPATAMESTGPDCGMQFQPSSTTYTLKNPGDSPIGYRIDGATGWAILSSTQGVLEAGASRTVSLTLDGSSLISKPGLYQSELKFMNTSNGQGNTQRVVKLTVKETQEWQVTLDGYYDHTLWTPREILAPGTAKAQTVKDTRHYRFDYDLAAKIMLEKKQGKWHYTCGRVIASQVKPFYEHTPVNLWKIVKQVCNGCAQINQMKGSALSGNVAGNTVQLLWTEVRPVLEVTAELGVKCWKNPKEPGSCGYSQKGGTAAYDDELFLSNAHDHWLPLTNKTYAPKGIQKKVYQYAQQTAYSYAIKRLR